MNPHSAQLRCEAIAPTRAQPSLADDVLAGLFTVPRSLPPKYFYDDHGSHLFDRICDQPEYYPTRTENALLAEIAGDVVARVAPRHIVELGSGTSRKTRHLLTACGLQGRRAVYAPFDVCDDILRRSGQTLARDYPWLEIRPLLGDYTAGLGNLPRPAAPALVVFLGGTIGNFSALQARDFLREVRATMGAGDALLLGADRVKDPHLLHAAYNDAAGVTAAFNRNVLDVMNRELAADFRPASYAHYAFYNPAETQIEMHLVAMADQRVRFDVLGRELVLAEGEHIQTEISRKFTRASLEALLRDGGFDVERHYEARGRSFSLVLARPD